MNARMCVSWLGCLFAVGCVGGQTGTPTGTPTGIGGGGDAGCEGKGLAQEAREPHLPSYEGTYALVGTRTTGGVTANSGVEAQGEPITLTLRLEGATEGEPLPDPPVAALGRCVEDDFVPVHVSLVSTDGTLQLATSAWLGWDGAGAALWIVAHEDGSPFADEGNLLAPVFGSVSLSEAEVLLTLLFRSEQSADVVNIEARGAR